MSLRNFDLIRPSDPTINNETSWNCIYCKCIKNGYDFLCPIHVLFGFNNLLLGKSHRIDDLLISIPRTAEHSGRRMPGWPVSRQLGKICKINNMNYLILIKNTQTLKSSCHIANQTYWIYSKNTSGPHNWNNYSPQHYIVDIDQLMALIVS